jgi:ferritin-like protein
MPFQIDLEALDVDGAVREAHAAAIDGLESGDTRLSFIKKMGVGTAGVFGGGALLATLAPTAFAAGGRPPSSFGSGDIGIANYALTLEYLEAEFYKQAVKNITFANPSLAGFARSVAADEKAHVAALKGVLKSKAVPSPSFKFGAATTDEATFAATAKVLENTGVGAYFGQGFNIKSPVILKFAISVLTVEARHAGAIGILLDSSGAGISPHGAFDVPLTAATVLKAVTGTGFIVKSGGTKYTA